MQKWSSNEKEFVEFKSIETSMRMRLVWAGVLLESRIAAIMLKSVKLGLDGILLVARIVDGAGRVTPGEFRAWSRGETVGG